jgi:hypothetical protein
MLSRQNPKLGTTVTPIVLATVLIYESIGPPVIRFILAKTGETNIEA